MSWALGRCCLIGQGALPLLSLKATAGPYGLCLQGNLREAGVIWVLHQEAAMAESVASCHLGICEKVKHPNGSSCSACFLESMSSRMSSMAGQHGVCWAAPGANMENHVVRLHVCVSSRLRYFFLIFTSLSLFFLVTVLVSFRYPSHTRFCISSFLFIVASFHFFFKYYFSVILFLFPHTFGKNPLHVSLFSLFSLFLFLSPNLLPFHSIGTREVVTQKNLSGLVPVRDLRLDPSLLCSIPLLALSPNLLIVWLFLSIAYLVAKLRCK